MSPIDSDLQSATAAPDYSNVPDNFPRPCILGAVSGVQPKLLMESYGGKFYATGNTPPEVYWRWTRCEDIAAQLATKALESKHGKRAHMSEIDILDQYLPRLIATRWTSEPEARFVIRRVAERLDWPVPASART